MLNKNGFVKENNYEGIILLEKNDFIFKCYSELNSNIKQFENEVWGINSDPDFNSIPLWKCYTIEDNNIIYGYIILSTRYFENGEIYMKVNSPTEISKTFLDIEDFVIINTKKVIKIMSDVINIIINDISNGNFDGFVINPNDYSKLFVKRLSKLKLPIKYYNYPKFRPVGYESIKNF